MPFNEADRVASEILLKKECGISQSEPAPKLFDRDADSPSWQDYLIKVHFLDIIKQKKGGKINPCHPAITIDFDQLKRYEEQSADDWFRDTGVQKTCKDALRRALIESPKATVALIEDALSNLTSDYQHQHWNVHVKNVPDALPINMLRTDAVGKLWAIDCVVSKVAHVRPVLTSGNFECARCKNVVIVPQEIGEPETKPSYCSCNEEKRGVFKLLAKESKYYDYQLVRLSEHNDACDDGRQPQTVDAYLLNDLAGINAGESVRIYGVPEMIAKRDRRDNVLTNKEIRVMVLGIDRQDHTEFVITPEDEKEIMRLKELPEITEMVVNSISPSIYGQRDLKRGVALALVSGEDLVFADGTVQRGCSHLLAVGDPAVGKSVVLKNGKRLAVRTTFLSGRGASGVGLTAAVVADNFGDTKWSIEAGALPRCNGGVVFMDELDKLNDTDRNCLHQVLEDGVVTIEKAGIHKELRAKTSLIAAANPKYGRFDMYTPIADQFNLDPALLSRFDLIIPYVDTVDEKNDRKVANYILSAHVGDDELITPEIPEHSLKKYLYYAKTKIHPEFKDNDCVSYLADIYVHIRSSSKHLKITPRQLGGIIRLARSNARLRLSNFIERSDVDAAVELYLKTLEQVAKGDDGNASISNIVGGSESQKARMSAIRKCMNDHKDKDGLAVGKVVKDLVAMGYKQPSVYRSINEMKACGDIIRLPNGRIILPSW